MRVKGFKKLCIFFVLVTLFLGVTFLSVDNLNATKTSLNILTPHSSPKQGEDWIVEFETKGKGGLKIIPNDKSTIKDDKFKALYCGDKKVTPKMLEGDVIYVKDWSCNKKGKIIHKTLKEGNHTLRFEFNGEIDFAYNASWLSDWGYRRKVTINSNKIDTELNHFPIPLFINSSSGTTSATNTTSIFDEVGSNFQKIAVTKSDGTTQIPIEVEKWDDTNKEAAIWTSTSSLSLASTTTTTLYFYYDNSKADNVNYVATTGSSVGEKIWDSNYLAVFHFNDPAEGGILTDSTSNGNDGTVTGGSFSSAANTTGVVGDAWDFSDAGAIVEFPDIVGGLNAVTIENWYLSPNYDDGRGFNTDGTGTGQVLLWPDDTGSQDFIIDGTRIQTNDNNKTGNVFMVGTWDGSTMKIFTDANEEGSGSHSSSINTGTNNYYGGEGGGSPYLNDKTDELRISNIARSAAWIKASYYANQDQLVTWGEEEQGNTAPNTPKNPSPSDNATGVSQNTTLSIDIKDIDGDNLNVSFYNASNDSLIGATTVTNTSATTTATTTWSSLSASTTYSWYVVSDDSNLAATSSTFSFTTNRPPNQPTNPVPSDTATNIATSTTLSVTASDPDNDTMDVTFYDGSDDSVINTDTSVASGNTASVTWSNLNTNTTYTWYAVSSDGTLVATSTTFSFTTLNQAPNQPTNPVPSDTATGVSLNPTLQVDVTDDDNDPMDVTFYNAADDSVIGTTTVTGTDSTTTATTTWNSLTSSTTYSWYVVSDDSNLAATSSTFSFTTAQEEWEVYKGSFLTTTVTGTTTISGLGFEPDVIEFTAANTVPSLNSEVGGVTDSFSWMHGFAKNGGDQFAMSVAGNSESQNGATGAATSNQAIDITYQRDGGVVGRDRATVTEYNNDGFKVRFDETYTGTYAASDQVVVQFTAYKLGSGVDANIGYFKTPTATGNQSIDIGFEPNYVKMFSSPIINDMPWEFGKNHVYEDNSYGWSKGSFTWNGSSISQQVMSITAGAYNINGHVSGASDSEAIRIYYTDGSNATINGTTTASVSSVDTNGFTLNYDSVYTGSYNPGTSNTKLVGYIAFDTPDSKTPEIGYFQTPTTTGEITINGMNFTPSLIKLTGVNTIPNINTQNLIGNNQNDGTFGWSHGIYHKGNQQVIHYAANSNSINAHGYVGSSTQSLYLLYTDQNGAIQGKDIAAISATTTDGFKIDFSSAYTGAGVPQDWTQVLVAYEAFPDYSQLGGNTAPNTPKNPSPTDEATSVSQNTTLSVDVKDSDGDILNVSFYNSSDDSLIGTTSVASTSATTTATITWNSLSASTTYSWYTKASDDSTTSTSNTWSFTTQKQPSAPTNPSPSDTATNIATSTTLSVDITDPEGDTMDVTFYNASDDSVINTDASVSSGGTASVTWSNLNTNTTYSWYAVSNDGQATSTQSTVWSFTTINSVPSISNPNPSDNATEISLDPALSVDVSDEDGDTIDVCFYNGDNDNQISCDTNVSSGGTATINWNNLSASTTYSWYVKATDGTATTTSANFDFTTQKAPNTPTNPSPVDGATHLSLDIELKVDVTDPEGDTMNVTFYDGADDSVIGEDTAVSSGGTATILWASLEYNTTYSWYAVSNDGEATTTSNTWSFTTDKKPDPPSNLKQYKSDCTTEITNNWTNETTVCLKGDITDPDGTDQVKLQVDYATSSSSFDNIVDVDSGSWQTATTTTSVSISSLTVGSSYKWQARAIDDQNGTSSFTQFNSGNTAFSIDAESPTGGSISYNDGYSSSTSISISLDDGTDSLSGIATSSRVIERKSASLSGGSCSSWSSFSNLVTGDAVSYPTYNDSSIDNGNCYQYRYVVSDKAGNNATYTSANIAKIDNQSPSVSFVSPSNSSWQSSDFKVVFSDSDLESGLSSCYCQIKDSGTVSLAWISRNCNSSTSIDISQYCQTEGEDKCNIETYNLDNAGNQSNTTSRSFSIDTESPKGVDDFSVINVSKNTVHLDWGRAFDDHFDHYEIWYGENESDVSNRAGSALEWDQGEDSNLSKSTTTQTTINGLLSGTTFYLKIWAVDKAGLSKSNGPINATTIDSETKKIFKGDNLRIEGFNLGL